MSKTLMIATLASSAVILGGCTLPFLPQADNESSTEIPTSETSTSESDAFSQIAAAMQSGSSLHCIAEMTDGTSRYDYYLKGSKFRLEGAVTTDGVTQNYNAINDMEYIYTWSNSQEQGVKFKVPTEEEMANQQEQYQDYMNNIPDFSEPESVESYQEQGYSINCQPAVVEDALFIPDSSINFQDMSAMMEQMQQQAMPSLSPEQQEQLQQMMDKMGN